MAGIRLINQPPETFRFPEWRDDVFYVADSVIRYATYLSLNDSDSDIRTRFYIALKDVDPGSGIPRNRLDLWGEVAASAVAVGQVVSQIIDNDSDIAWLRDNIVNIKLEHDSDVGVIVGDHDSDKKMTYHDYLSADSDLLSNVDSDVHDLKAFDSDFRVDVDSDFVMTYHDYRSADSDLLSNVDSDVHDLKSFDSEINSALTQTSWDYGSTF